MAQPPDGMEVSLIDDNDIYKWQVTMAGPEGSLYAVS
jgi:ubiquitin-protein ligase